jgi:hypothetical protein
MGESQEGELRGFLSPSLGLFTSKASKRDATRLFGRYFQAKPFETVRKLRFKTRGICLMLKTSYKIVSKTKIVRLATTLLKEATTKPQIQHIMQVDIGQ